MSEKKESAAVAVIEKPGDNAVAVGLVDGQSFALAQRVANLLATSTLVPKHYQGNMGNCVIALNMAARIGADPLMVMQNLYVVHGSPSWSAQFLIACFNKCGRFSALRYEFFESEGKDEWGCRAWAVELSTGERLDGTKITIALAKKEGWYSKAGSKWQTMPQQMLMYRAAAWFVRAYAPEIAMGLHTAEEIRDGAIDVTPVDDSATASATTEALRAAAERTTAATFPTPKVACPNENNDLVNVTECDACGSRQGCPSH